MASTALLLALLVASAYGQLYYNATVRTVDERTPLADAFVVEGGLFAGIGRFDDLAVQFPAAPRVDLGGRSVLPGLADAHVHLTGQGYALMQVNLVGTQSLAEAIERMLDFVEENPLEDGEWLLGRGWDQNVWGTPFPSKEDLDPYFPSNPVWMTRVDGHAAWANSATLAAVPELPDEDPEGGQIIRDEDGEPTGIFIDNAMSLVEDYIPDPTPEERYEAVQAAIAECVRLGLTSVHDAGIPAEEIANYKLMIDNGDFHIRNYAMVACAVGTYVCPEVSPIFFDYGNRLTVRAVKLSLDGALGSWGAAMLEPYSDNNSTSGLLLIPEEEILPTIRAWASMGYQVNTHCIGDRAVRLALDAYESVVAEFGADLRHRIEHAQICSLDDLPRFAELGVLPSMQPTHAISDMLYAEDRVGPERILGAYAWRTLRDSGARLPLGSDFPVEPVNPFSGIYAAVTRQSYDGEPPGGWYPEQRLTVAEALQGFTLEPAYAAHQEDKLGSISVGKLADFIVIDRDIFEIDPSEIQHTVVLATFVGGDVVFCSSEMGQMCQ